MQSPNIILVAGFPGVGKTAWIQQQLNNTQSATYLNLGAGTVPIDATVLATEFPGLVALADEQLSEFLQLSANHSPIYIELGFQIDLTSLVLPVDSTHYQRVVVVPPGAHQAEWEQWSEVFVVGAEIHWQCDQPQIWRSLLTGQVLDLASLNTFWYELTHAAYGKLHRAKGIFDLADGRSMHFDFVAGLPKPDRPETDRTELDLPLWIEGRPDRFGGIEVIGEALDQRAIAQTLTDCCLDDAAIAYYQAQIREALGEEAA